MTLADAELLTIIQESGTEVSTNIIKNGDYGRR